MTEKELDDTTLIQETIAGNQVAQKVLYDKYKRVVKDYLHNKYRKYSDVDDDISEIMIKVFLNLSAFDAGKSKFKSWVLYIARNHMIDKWRSNSITLTSFSTGDVSTSTLNNNAHCTFFELEDSSSTLNNSVLYSSNNTANFDYCNSLTYLSSQISATEYTMLDMKYIQGFNYSEIGMEFNLTSSTVSNKVNYIKTKLKKNYSDVFEE